MRPNFLIVGAPRCGTTALYEGLAQHPDVFMSPRKEPWFAGFTGDPGPWRGPLDAQPVRDWDEYERLFDGADGFAAVGEASTLYLAYEDAPRRIRESLPGVRIIAIVRDPTQRAYSNFLEHVQEGRERELDFARALAAEPERRRRGWAPSWGYAALGRYGQQLTRYFAEFPREHMLVMLYEDLRERAALYGRVFSFLGVDPSFVPDLPQRTNQNSGIPKSPLLHKVLTSPNPLRRALRSVLSDSQRHKVRSWLLNQSLERPQLDPVLRQALTARFRDDILRTSDLLERDLSSWLSPLE